MPSVSRRWWRIVVPIIALALAIVAGEIGMRVTQAAASERSLEISDAMRGWALRPGFRGWTDTEGRVWVEINRAGMRDREHDLAKPPTALRVAVLGDSFMQGVNVSVEKTFPSFLEHDLSGCARRTSRQVEVLNFGVGGYGTAQELLTYRAHASRYHPDIVVLAIYTGNDIFNNHRALNEQNQPPYFVLRDNQLLREEPPAEEPATATVPWHQALRMSVTDRMLTARLVWDFYALLRAPFVALQVEEVPRRDQSATETARMLYDPLQTGPIVEAWAVTEALIATLAREVALQGSEFWLVTLSNSEQVDPDVAKRRHLTDLLSVDDLFYPDRRIRDFASAQGIRVISLAEPMAAYAAANRVFLNGGNTDEFPPGTGHWNETAYRLAAGLVSERLCTESASLNGRP